MDDWVTVKEVYEQLPEQYVICAVVQRDKRNFATKYEVIVAVDTHEEYVDCLAYLKADGVEDLIGFCTKAQNVIAFSEESESEFFTPEESAANMRSYYGLNKEE